MGKPDPPSPDPKIGEAAVENSQLGKDQLAFARQQYADSQDRQTKIDDYSKKFADQQLADSAFNSKQAHDQWDSYTSTFQPIEKQMAEDATNYDSPDRADAAANSAGVTATHSFDDAQEALARTQGRMGISPLSGRFGASSNTLANQRALTEAGAETTARDGVSKMGIMLRKDAAGFGRGLSGTAAQSFGVATAGGGAGQGALTGAAGTAMSAGGIMNAGFGGAMNGNSSMMNGLSQQYQDQLASYNANAHKYDGLMKLAGTVGGAYIGTL